MAVTLTNGRVLTPAGLQDDLDVVIEDGLIAAVLPRGKGRGDLDDLQGGLLTPGFIDTQVNGGGGVLFNDDPTAEGASISKAPS